MAQTRKASNFAKVLTGNKRSKAKLGLRSERDGVSEFRREERSEERRGKAAD